MSTKSYINTKLIQAEPCEAYETTGEYAIGDLGYRIYHPNGYTSWVPKAVFEAEYLEVPNNPELKTDAPSISEEMVNDFIISYECTTIGKKTTVCTATLRNGFEITESTGCVSEENYDEATGTQICMQKIKDKVWFLLGFLLQQSINGVSIHN